MRCLPFSVDAAELGSLMRGRKQARCGRAGFTLIELLVVIAIIAVLAALGFVATSGALKSARKAEARTMANQIKLAISSYYTEYGIYPTVTVANTDFLNAMTGATNVSSIPNRRGIRFLEVPSKYTNGSGIVTPAGLYKDRAERRTYNIAADTNYDGIVQFNPGSGATNMSGSVAVWVGDPDRPTNSIGSW